MLFETLLLALLVVLFIFGAILSAVGCIVATAGRHHWDAATVFFMLGIAMMLLAGMIDHYVF